jgi:hypothetical protein
MRTEFERILLRDGNFGRLLRQITGGPTPFYLVVTDDSSERIVAAGDFAVTNWDGIDRRQGERRQGERRTVSAPPVPNKRERREIGRRAGERRQFAVGPAAGM